MQLVETVVSKVGHSPFTISIIHIGAYYDTRSFELEVVFFFEKYILQRFSDLQKQSMCSRLEQATAIP